MVDSIWQAPDTACSRPAQLPKLSISFDGWRSGWWRAADAQPLGGASQPYAQLTRGYDTVTRSVIVGASGWSYFVPYQPDINKALQELRQKVFQEGSYFKPAEWAKRLYEHKIISEEELNNRLSRLALVPEPQTIEELIEQRGETGTHSIIDMDVVSSVLDFGTVVPLPKEDCIELFGTDKPSRKMIEETTENLESFTGESCTGMYIVVYENDLPTEIYFTGYSGD